MKKIAMSLIFFALLLFSCNIYAEDNKVEKIYCNTISANLGSYFAIDQNGTLWGWAEGIGIMANQSGQLGDGTTEERKKPIKILNNVNSVSAGISHTVAIKKDGSLWAWGDNTYGQFGNGTYESSLVPIKIMDDVIGVSAGNDYTFIIKKDKSLWWCGDWGEKTTNIPQMITNDVKKAVTGNGGIILKEDGSVWNYNNVGAEREEANIFENCFEKIIEKTKDIFSGESSGLAITEDDTLWFWGTNYDTSIGKETIKHDMPIKYGENIKYAESCFNEFCMVITKDDTLWIYGDPDATENPKIYENELKLPMKILEDVNCISGWGNVSPQALILQNDGELYHLEIPRKAPEDGEKAYKLTKMLDNVRLSGEYEFLQEKAYTDLSNQSKETQEAVEALTKAGIVEGTSETEFSPEAAVTRAEAAAMFLRMAGIEEAEDNGGFSDVSHDRWYYGVAGASKEYGIISGFEDNTFRGDETVTREQMIVLAARMLRKEKGCEIPQDVSQYLRFDDADEISGWAREDIALASREGLISEQEKQLRPSEPMRRGEAAVILYRLYNQI